MNYSVLMTFAVIAFSIVYYYVWGKGQYRGPLVERDGGPGAALKNGPRSDSVGAVTKVT